MKGSRWGIAGVSLGLPLVVGMAVTECGPGGPGTPDAASGSDGSLVDAGSPEASPEASSPDGSGVPTATCTFTRYIAFNNQWEDASANPCQDVPIPDAGTWRGAVLFSAAGAEGQTEADADTDWQNLPKRLRDYCAFQWDGVGAADTTQLSVKLSKAQVAPDLSVVSPVDSFGTTSCTAIANQGAQSACAPLWHLAQVAAQIPDASPDGSITPVPVVVLDTNRTGDASDPLALSPHGAAVGAVIEGLACSGSGPCSADVRWQLALPRQGCADDYDGGEFGSLGQIAAAVWAASSSPHVVNHILNLSLGWVHPADAGVYVSVDAGGALLPAEAAVYDALRFAYCRRALIFAAAGNAASAVATESGPLYPAAWDGVTAPNPSECEFYYAGAPGFPVDASAEPLLYAVGGVDFADRPLANARGGALPALAAYGSGVTAPRTPGGADYTPVMTGTSMATATASAVAALTWARMPSTFGWDVVAAMYNSGTALDASADFPMQTPVRRVSACNALAKACSFPGSGCEGFGQCPSAPWTPSPAVPTAWGLESLPMPTACSPLTNCGFVESTSNSIDQPWGNPQPNGSGCNSCVMSQELQLDAVLSAAPPSPPLVVLHFEGQPPLGYVLQTSAKAFQVTLPPSDSGAKLVGATLTVPDSPQRPGTFDAIVLTP